MYCKNTSHVPLPPPGHPPRKEEPIGKYTARPGVQCTRGGALGRPPQDETLPGTPCSRSGDKSDETPMLFYHAEVPEIKLNVGDNTAVLQLGLLHWECQDAVYSLPGTGYSHLLHVRVIRYIYSQSCLRSFSVIPRPPWTASLRGRFATS